MSTHYASVASDLIHAGLTAEQWEAYRQALFTALSTEALVRLQDSSTAIEPVAGSVVAQNIAWLAAHASELAALRATGMWFPKLDANAGGT